MIWHLAYTGAYGKHNKQENTINEQTTHRSLQDYVDQVQKQRIEFEVPLKMLKNYQKSRQAI